MRETNKKHSSISALCISKQCKMTPAFIPSHSIASMSSNINTWRAVRVGVVHWHCQIAPETQKQNQSFSNHSVGPTDPICCHHAPLASTVIVRVGMVPETYNRSRCRCGTLCGRGVRPYNGSAVAAASGYIEVHIACPDTDSPRPSSTDLESAPTVPSTRKLGVSSIGSALAAVPGVLGVAASNYRAAERGPHSIWARHLLQRIHCRPWASRIDEEYSTEDGYATTAATLDPEDECRPIDDGGFDSLAFVDRVDAAIGDGRCH